MKKSEIIARLKGYGSTDHDLEAAFQAADLEQNFSFKFGKTREYWNSREWNTVASAVKAKM